MPFHIDRGSDRGSAQQGWLTARHSFSFADWHDPQRMGFGALKVLNDDIFAAGGGFGPHPHENFEIVTIPLEGRLRHQDDAGHQAEIGAGDVQMMSAGQGVVHSEINASATKPVSLIQVWITPEKTGGSPRYAQRFFDWKKKEGVFYTLVEPDAASGVNPQEIAPLRIHQKAWIRGGRFAPGTRKTLLNPGPNHGLYLFVLEGSVLVQGASVGRRDAFAGWGETSVRFEVPEDGSVAEVLLFEVPLLGQDPTRH